MNGEENHSRVRRISSLLHGNYLYLTKIPAQHILEYHYTVQLVPSQHIPARLLCCLQYRQLNVFQLSLYVVHIILNSACSISLCIMCRFCALCTFILLITISVALHIPITQLLVAILYSVFLVISCTSYKISPWYKFIL